MSRTKFYNIKKRRTDGKQQYRSFLFPEFEERSTDVVIEIDEFTRLDIIAEDFFDDASLWWVVAAYNNIGNPSLYVEDKQYLRIPDDIQTVFDKIKRFN